MLTYFCIIVLSCSIMSGCQIMASKENDLIELESHSEIKVEKDEVMIEVNEEEVESVAKDLVLTQALKKDTEGNPLITHAFGADPYAMVYKDRVYVYMTNDELMYDKDNLISTNTYGDIRSLRCLSSADMVNWTDHGLIHIGGLKGVTTWANNSWAPAASWKEIDGKDQFFLYFANSASSIGVLVADSPIGPFRDPIGRPLVTRETPNCQDVTWMFDPAVLIDDDGVAYLYFGGGIPEGREEYPNTSRVIVLGDDMISTVGEAVTIEAPYLFEDSGINKIGDTYYYSYCSHFGTRDTAQGEFVPEKGVIIYMTSDSPLGPWTYQGPFLKNPGHFFGTGGNNHHCIVNFKDRWFIFYHAFLLQDARGHQGGYRSTNVNELFLDEDNLITSVEANRQGVDQIVAVNPFEKQPFAMMALGAGVLPVEADKKSFKDILPLRLGEIDEGDWLLVRGVDFGERAPTKLRIEVVGDIASGGIQISLEQLKDNKLDLLLFSDAILQNHDMIVLEFNLQSMAYQSTQDLYFTFIGSGYELVSWQFIE
jgi:arabinoxylan arabinofuranohydrolase